MPSTNHRHLARSSFVSFEDFMKAYSIGDNYNSHKDKNCRFCSKILDNKGKMVRVYNRYINKIYICNNCKYLFEIIRREVDAKNEQTIRNITAYLT